MLRAYRCRAPPQYICSNFKVTINSKLYKSNLACINTENKAFLELNTYKMKMNAKNLMVSFMTIAMVMLLVAPTVAAAQDVTSDLTVTVDDVNVAINTLSVEAGQTIEVEASFTSDIDASDITVKAEIEGDKVDVSVLSNPFDVENGLAYIKTLSIQVPYELKDDLSEDIVLTVTVKKNGNFKTEAVESYSLRKRIGSRRSDVDG